MAVSEVARSTPSGTILGEDSVESMNKKIALQKHQLNIKAH